MLGYVKTYIPELKIIEDKYYKSAYCGLCKAMKGLTGSRSRLLLSYDFTYLVLVRLAVTGEKPEFEQKRCGLHPFKKKLIMKSNAAIELSAYAGVLLAYHKMCDDIADEKGKKRFAAWLARLFFKKTYKNVSTYIPELDRLISEQLSELSYLENERVSSVDRPAGIFGALMSDIFSYGLDGEKAKIASEIGFATGKWLYIVDALDDFDEDLSLNRYNPFVLLFDGTPIAGEKKTDVEAALMRVLDKARNAVDLIDFSERRDLCGLIGNILNEGLPRMAESVLCNMKSKDKKDGQDANLDES